MLQFPYSPMMRQLLHLVPKKYRWIHSNMTPQNDRCSDMSFSRKNAFPKIRILVELVDPTSVLGVAFRVTRGSLEVLEVLSERW